MSNRGHAEGCKGGTAITFVDGTGKHSRAYVCHSCMRVALNTGVNQDLKNIRFVPVEDILIISDKLREIVAKEVDDVEGK